RLDVLGDAHHVAARHGVGAHLDALTDRIPAGPERLGHRIAHHHGPRRMLRVLRADAAAAQDARTERGEVLRGHGVKVELTQAAHRVDAGDVEIHVPGTPEWHRELARSVLDSRDRLRGLAQVAAQRDPLAAL